MTPEPPGTGIRPIGSHPPDLTGVERSISVDDGGLDDARQFVEPTIPGQLAAPAASPIGTDSLGTGPMRSSPGAGPIQTGPIHTGPIQTGPLQTGPIQTGPIQTGPIQTGPIHTGPIHTGPIQTGPIGVERLQADRLVSDRPRAESDTGGLPVSLPEVLQPAWFEGAGPTARPTTRHRSRARRPEEPPRADRVLLVYLAVVVLVIAAVGAGGAWLMMRSDRSGSGTASTVDPAGRTLLVGLTDGTGLAAAFVLGSGPGAAACVVVPPSLLVEMGGKRVPLSRTVAGGPGSPGQALGRTLNVRVDAGWLITMRGLTSLVDAGGGAVVDVDREIRSGTLLIAAGPGQRLTGAQAVAFVTVGRDGEAAQAAGERFARVLAQALSGLPTQQVDAQRQLGELGAASASDLSSAQLASVLTAAGRAVVDAGRLAVTALPVTAAGSGNAAGSVVADRVAAGNLVRQKLGASAASPDTGTASGAG